MSLMKVSAGDVIQFNENHPWAGALAVVTDVKPTGDDVKITAGVPMLENNKVAGTTYIFTMQSKNEFDPIGRASMMPMGDAIEAGLLDTPGEEGNE